MSDIQFFQTKMGRQFYEVTMPELVRQLHRLNDLLGLAIELKGSQFQGKGEDQESKDRAKQ